MLMTSPQQFTEVTGQYPAQPGRRDGRRTKHHWPACHRSSHALRKPLDIGGIHVARPPHRVQEEPAVAGPLTLRRRPHPRTRRHPINQSVKRPPCFLSAPALKRRQRLERARQPVSPFPGFPILHAHAFSQPFQKGAGASAPRHITRGPKRGPGVHNRSQRAGAHSLGLRPGHKFCLPVEPQPTGNFLPAGHPAAFGKRVMKPPPRGSVRDLNTIPFMTCLSGSLLTECAFPFPCSQHSQPPPLMANTHDRRAIFAYREKGYEALPPATAAHQPYR